MGMMYSPLHRTWWLVVTGQHSNNKGYTSNPKWPLHHVPVPHSLGRWDRCSGRSEQRLCNLLHNHDPGTFPHHVCASFVTRRNIMKHDNFHL